MLKHELDLIERTGNPNNTDAAALAQLINTISALVERMVRAHNQTAFAKTELKAITVGMQSILYEFIADPSR